MSEAIKILEEALDNLRKDRIEVYSRIDALTAESKTYSQPQKELSIAKSIAKLFDVLQKINSEIIKISAQLDKALQDETEFKFGSSSAEDDVYSSIGDEITMVEEE